MPAAGITSHYTRVDTWPGVKVLSFNRSVCGIRSITDPDDLRTGALAPGERLVEVTLAKQLGVSRTPVREALFQLASDGLLAESSRGYMLPVHTTEEIRDRLEIRRLLEREILRRACEEASDRQIKTLIKALEEERKYINGGRCQQVHRRQCQFSPGAVEPVQESVIDEMRGAVRRPVPVFFVSGV